MSCLVTSDGMKSNICERYQSSEYLNAEARDALERVHTDDPTWHPTLFDQAADNWRQSGPMFFQDQSNINRNMIKALWKCLLSLRNLNAVRYHYDQGWTPARFGKVPRKVSAHILFHLETPTRMV